jgi:hypothetical protein
MAHTTTTPYYPPIAESENCVWSEQHKTRAKVAETGSRVLPEIKAHSGEAEIMSQLEVADAITVFSLPSSAFCVLPEHDDSTLLRRTGVYYKITKGPFPLSRHPLSKLPLIAQVSMNQPHAAVKAQQTARGQPRDATTTIICELSDETTVKSTVINRLRIKSVTICIIEKNESGTFWSTLCKSCILPGDRFRLTKIFSIPCAYLSLRLRNPLSNCG